MNQIFVLKTRKMALFFLATFLFMSQPAIAQLPSYKVEVIVFEHLALKGWTEEYWPEDIETPATHGSTSVFTRNKKPLWINKRNHSLVSAAQRLNKQGYRILFHQAWSQVAYARKNSPTVLIENDQGRASNLLGTVRLYKTRYAHVDIDLELERRIPSKVLEAFAQNQKLAPGDLPSHWRFNVKESRKIKPKELHYIDHPLFGVLVQIRKI